MVNGYTVVEAIGKGAYGAVYEVHKGENRYALKEIPLESIEGTEDEFHREVAIYKELDHPNIVKFHTSFVENNILYIVMELIEG